MTNGQNDFVSASIVNEFLGVPLDQAHGRLTKDEELITAVCGYCVPNGEWSWGEDDKEKNRFLSVVPPLLTRLAAVPGKSTVFLTMIYYLYDSYPWVKQASQKIAIEYVNSNKHAMERLDEDLMKLLEPAFVMKHEKVSEAGRKKVSTQETSFNQKNVRFFDTRYPWEVDNSTLSVFEYFIREYPVQEHWAFVTPAVLNIADHHNASIKAKGCAYIEVLLRRVDRAFFAATGLEPVFWDAVTPSLSYLPPSTPQPVSLKLICQAIEALFAICDTMADPSRRYNEMMRTAVFKGMAYGGEKIALAELLLEVCRRLITRMGIQACIHLKQLVVIFNGVLMDPFGSAYPPLIESVCNTLILVYTNCWPRIDGYKYDIARGVISCWQRLHQEDSHGAGNESTKKALKNAWRGLDDIVQFSKDDMDKLQREFDIVELVD
ncbi:hypothetical protein TRVA0_034S00562 [Trichomonascus vanleenenianus]|uniref:Tti2 family protein n=1 Tax=Trichomonascus vanleenenianus TaxID=2268995 RepID=UPI003EC9785E